MGQSRLCTLQLLAVPFYDMAMATLAYIPTCSLLRWPCKAVRVAKARQVGVPCQGAAESGGAGRRGVVVGSAVGTVVLVGSAAVAAVVAARAMATSGGGPGREAAILATRRGMQLFAQV